MRPDRVLIDKVSPEIYRRYAEAAAEVRKAVDAVGLSRALMELVNMRCSQINGCARCLSVHRELSEKAGVTEQQLAVLPAWRESDLFDDQTRAALEIAELVTELPAHEVANRAYDRATDILDAEQISVVVWAAITINAFNRVSILSGHQVLPR